MKDVDGTHSCREHWPKGSARQFFTVVSLILQYLVPCAIITYCYIHVSLALRFRARSRAGLIGQSRERERLDLHRKRRTTRMLVAMIAIFMCCWLPLNVVLLVRDYGGFLTADSSLHFLLFFTAHVIAMSSTTYNPFLYAWMNDSFRREFKTLLPRLIFRTNTNLLMNGDGQADTTIATGEIHGETVVVLR